uniref:major facilitator superfamily domain-containing protein 8-like n=1 Tax=Styela clava TaxID=7725 RepID=UPI001939E273|nr:major facilitator superfamily domain-containing protein 8-like [Styela clava]
MDKTVLKRNVSLGLFFFFVGVEYSVIIPTLNGYLSKLGASQEFLGIVIASFSFTGLITAPIYGRITDTKKSGKLCILVGNVFEVAGNFLYFGSNNKYLVLSARVVAGIGSGATSSIFGMLARSTTSRDRTSVFSLLMSLRQLGLLVGPIFSVLLNKLDAKLGPFVVDQYTSPGLLMAVDSGMVNDDFTQTSVSEEPTSGAEILVQDHISNMKTVAKELLQDGVIVCFTATFVTMFTQIGLETSAAPLTLLFFQWTGLQNSYLFSGAAFVMIFSFFILSFLSARFKISDRAILLIGCIGMSISYIMMLTGAMLLQSRVNLRQSFKLLLPIFLINAVVLTVSIPFVWVPQASLLSRLTSMSNQAFIQGIRQISMGLGQIMGPLWAASLLTYNTLPILLSIDLFLILLLSSMTVYSYKGLSQENSEENESDEALLIEENSPILE